MTPDRRCRFGTPLRLNTLVSVRPSHQPLLDFLASWVCSFPCDLTCLNHDQDEQDEVGPFHSGLPSKGGQPDERIFWQQQLPGSTTALAIPSNDLSPGRAATADPR
jgi:hypothetical protein